MSERRLRLGELLLSRGVCSRDRLREAWEQRVVFGDRLGTNLLAVGAIDERTLAQALGHQLGVHSGHGKVLKVDPAAVRLLPKTIAERRFVVPHHVQDKKLYLLMRDPLDAFAIDDVRFATGLGVIPILVCEARMWSLLETHYGLHPSLRPVPLDDVVVRPQHVLDEQTSPARESPELTSEEDFQSLYAGLHDGSMHSIPLPELPAETPVAAPPPPTVAPVPELRPSFVPTMPARPAALAKGGEGSFLAPPKTGPEEGEWRDAIENTNPMLALPRPAPSQEETYPLVDLVEATVTEPSMRRQPTLDFHIDVGDIVEDSPLSFTEASRLLSAAADRTAIARVVLRAARSRFARACLLSVYPDRFVGWMGIGEGFETERLRGLVIERGLRSVFSLVADSRSYYLGPLTKAPAHGAWVKATGRKIPKSLAVFPILVRGRPINLLVVDEGHDRHVSPDVGEVLILAQQIAGTYETLIATL
ncbi:MAG: hypothetical protein A2138_01125 [Deltaproteobacteria bacterium RBG_16_71_12]|nr:MAG: hypothetical protein A2138_01125 [Deltaproteobacteria bacterium RBG_16_71_12]